MAINHLMQNQKDYLSLLNYQTALQSGGVLARVDETEVSPQKSELGISPLKEGSLVIATGSAIITNFYLGFSQGGNTSNKHEGSYVELWVDDILEVKISTDGAKYSRYEQSYSATVDLFSNHTHIKSHEQIVESDSVVNKKILSVPIVSKRKIEIKYALKCGWNTTYVNKSLSISYKINGLLGG